MLGAFALGLPGHVLVKALSPVFFAREDTRTPMLAALLGLAVAVIGSLAFMAIGTADRHRACRSRCPAGSAPRCCG